MQLVRQLSTIGLFVGTLFFAFSLTPSLLSRSFAFQGLVSGVSLTLGYALGAWGRWLWSYLEIPVPDARTQRVLRLAATSICIVTAAGFLWRATDWQNSVRTLMGLPEVGGVQPVGVASMALAVFAAFLVLARIFQRAFRVLARVLHRFLPPRVSNVIGILAAAALLWAIANGVIFTRTLRVADESYQRLETILHDEMGRPDEPMKTGSSQSLIAWRDLADHGRRFVSSGPTAGQLSAFHGVPAPEPIRVYVGRNSAETPRARRRCDRGVARGRFTRVSLQRGHRRLACRSPEVSHGIGHPAEPWCTRRKRGRQ